MRQLVFIGFGAAALYGVTAVAISSGGVLMPLLAVGCWLALIFGFVTEDGK